MIRTTTPEIERARHQTPDNAGCAGTPFGTFTFLFGKTGATLHVIAADADEMVALQDGLHGPLWEHVSVSVAGQKRCPSWEEMCFVKRLFWPPEETVIQFHPAESAYVNCHPFTLHLWRKAGEDHVLPDPRYIGPRPGSV